MNTESEPRFVTSHSPRPAQKQQFWCQSFGSPTPGVVVVASGGWVVTTGRRVVRGGGGGLVVGASVKGSSTGMSRPNSSFTARMQSGGSSVHA